jgi:hypothetical protein
MEAITRQNLEMRMVKIMQDGNSNYGRVVQENGLLMRFTQTETIISILFVKTNNVLKEVVLKELLFQTV